MREETIAAISTPLGVGGISVIRLSGSRAVEILEQVFTPYRGQVADMEERKMTLGEVKTQYFCDKVLAVRFVAPRSFTGEDVVEIHAHGGVRIAQGILHALLQAGAVLAENGEFTKRAFLHGKLDLTAAEGMIEMIHAKSDAEVNAGYRLLKSELRTFAEEIQQELTDLLAHTQVVMDYPEEDIEYVHSLQQVLQNCIKRITSVLQRAEQGKMIREGFHITLCGRPNTGKSSLFNALLQFDRAIVTDIAGTTRDTLEESYAYRGMRVIVTDTAGLRQTGDVVEKIGVELAREAVQSADLVLFLLDASEGVTPQDAALFPDLAGKRVLFLLNKEDLSSPEQLQAMQKTLQQREDIDWAQRKQEKTIQAVGLLSICAKDREVEALKEWIYTQFMYTPGNEMILTNERHINALQRTLESLRIAAQTPEQFLDCIQLEVQSAWEALGEITGTTANERIIDTIFQKFCVGK